MPIRITKNVNNIPKLTQVMRKIAGKEIVAGVFGDDNAELVKIARAQEFGANVRPKNGKYLALPTKLAGRNKRPRDFSDLKFLKTSSGGILFKGGGKKGMSLQIYFILLKSVRIPERSFVRAGFDKNIGELEKKVKKHMNDVMRFRINPDLFMDMIGLELAGLIQKELRNVSSPSNAPLTVSVKGSSNPLIDRGQLVANIRHKIR